MAELMVGVSTGMMKPLLGKLAILMGEEYAKQKNLRKEVKFISDELIGMKDALESISYLDDLDPQTQRWRDIVREMSYDIEDIIDDFIQKVGEKDDGFVSNTIQRVKTLGARHKIAAQIEDIRNLVIETSARRQRYKLDIPIYKHDTPSSSNVVIDPRVAMLYENAAKFVGVEAPANKLVNLLADEDKKLKIVSIVGFGGLGKTTLANVVHCRLKGKFKQSAFVPVSQKPDIPELLHSLLSQLGDTTSHNSELKVLLDQLREYLHNKRYFIVIDDIWDLQAWGIIKCAFPENNLGSRVIVTTRIRNVAKACCLHVSDHIFEMKPLSDEDSRRLFLERIFGSDEACPVQLKDALDEILKRCGGLPLAIISISSMLASEDPNQKERWEHVRGSLGSEIDITLERMRKILNLSYKDLPPHLRTCFLYIGMYPEDYKIVRSKLERQWMAEGFISKENGKDVEKVARSYFNELVNRSLIQPVDFDDRGSVTSCRVHDMMLDLILIKSAEENFFIVVDGPQSCIGLDYKIRRLSIRMQQYDVMLVLANISMSQIRTIMLFGGHEGPISLSECKFLRVLLRDDSMVDFVPSVLRGLCKLYHLRYLHITGNSGCELPLRASVLKYLETLHLYDNGFSWDSHFCQGKLLPDGIVNMKSLQYLTGFDYTVNTVDDIKGLGELANLRYLFLLCTYYILDPKKKRSKALCSSLGRLSSLQELLLAYMGNIDGLFPSSPPPSPYLLQTLRMTKDCWFSKVPSWMGELRCLSELQCNVVELLDDGIGILADLPVLCVLHIQLRGAQSEMIVFPGKAFPALKLLKIELGKPGTYQLVFSRKAFPVVELFKIDLRKSRASYLTFQPGAMPDLQKLEVTFTYKGSGPNVVPPTGLEHLLALKEIRVDAMNHSEKSSFGSAISMHPGNPRFIQY